MPKERSSLIAGRLAVRECVTWSNHELIGQGCRPVTAQLKIPRTEIECFYVNGQEIPPTAQQILDLQAAILEDRRRKTNIRREKANAKKAMRAKLDALEEEGQLTGVPSTAPPKYRKRNSTRSRERNKDEKSDLREMEYADEAVPGVRKKKDNPCASHRNRRKRKLSDEEEESEEDVVEDEESEVLSEEDYVEKARHEDDESEGKDDKDSNIEDETLSSDDTPNDEGWYTERQTHIPGFSRPSSMYRKADFFYHKEGRRYTCIDIVYKKDAGKKYEHYFQCVPFYSNDSIYFSCKTLLEKDACIWEFNQKLYDELIRGKVFADDEDSTALYYVADIKFYSDYGKVCCYCFPFDGDFEKARSIAAASVKNGTYEEENIWVREYVHARVDAYDTRFNLPVSSQTSVKDLPVSRGTSTSNPKTDKSTCKRATSGVTKEASKAQLKLLHKLFAVEGRGGRSGKSYFVAEVKYMPEYDQVCCCCVHVQDGDLNNAMNLAAVARGRGSYKDNCVFDCDYVRIRVDACK